MSYQKIELDNGLKIAGFHMPDMESVSLGIWINTGGRYERKELAGISHFLEHLVFRGTKDRSAKEIKESIEGVGGMLNAFTAEEFTCYLVKIPAKHLKISLDVLSDMVNNACLSGDDVEKERMVILEEIKMYLDLPSHYVHELLNQLLWPKHPLGMFLAGTAQTVLKITPGDIKNYRDTFYQPQNVNIVACGAFDCDKLIDAAGDCFLKYKKGKISVCEKVNIKQDRPQTNFYNKATEQTHISLGVHSFCRDHKDRYALTLLHIILGANMSSRLFQEVREKRGLAYEIGAQVKKFQDTGAFVVNAGVEHRKAPKAIEVIMNELRKTKKKSVRKDEFSRAKEYFTGQLLLALEDTMDHMLWLGENVSSLNKIYTRNDVLKELNKTTIDDLKRVANEIFKSGAINLALIGPVNIQDKKAIEEALFL